VMDTEEQLTADEVEELVKDYKDPESDTEAAKKLLNAFYPYHQKFIKIIKRSTCNISDEDSREFIGLFIEDKETKDQFIKNWNTGWAKKVGTSRASFLTELCKNISYEEISQECKLITLKLADRYEDLNRSFLAYISSSFKYELKRSLDELTQDPLVMMQNYNIPYDYHEIDSMEGSSYIVNENMQYDENAFTMKYEELGPDWIRGITCSREFKDLDLVERKIIKYYYLDDLTDEAIGNEIGYSRQWAHEMRQRTIKKLKEKIVM